MNEFAALDTRKKNPNKSFFLSLLRKKKSRNTNLISESEATEQCDGPTVEYMYIYISIDDPLLK